VYDASVMRRRLFPHWLRRGIQAGVLGTLLSSGTLLAFELSRPAPRAALPHGVDGSLIVVPALLALGVLATGVPVVLAATRSEAVLGAVAGYMVGADLLMLISLLFRQSVAVDSLGVSWPLGVLAAVLAFPVALAGIALGPLLEVHGFGRSAGLRALVAACVVATVVALAAPFVVW
jgi:hypothetical protein